MILSSLNQDMVRLCIQSVPLLLCVIVYRVSSLLWPDHHRFLSYWLTICNLIICSMLLGLPSIWSTDAPRIGVQIIHGFFIITSAQFVFVLISAFLSSFSSIPESRLYFRGLQLCKSIAFSLIIAFFVFFSMPSVSLAATSLVVGFSFSGSVMIAHGLDSFHEDRGYIRHLLMLGLNKSNGQSVLANKHRISDSALQYIVSGLRLLYQPLETTSIQYNGNHIRLSNALHIPTPIDVSSAPPRGWIQGALAHKNLLETENHRLYSFLRGVSSTSSHLLHSNNPSKIEDSQLALNNFDLMLDHNLHNNFVRNKIELISFSPKLFEAFSILGNWVAEDGPLFITGPAGSGRRTLATATLKKIGCKDVLMFDASSIQDEFSLVHNLEELFEGYSYTGAVISNAEILSKNSWDLIQTILTRKQVRYTIALTGEESILQHVNQTNATVVRLSPLHERIEDLFFQTLYFSREACRECGVSNLVIDNQAIQELLRTEFPENSRTLRNLCFDAVRSAHHNKITSFILGSGKQLRSSMI